MVQAPDKQQQILIAHAGLIHRVVKAVANRAQVPDLDQVLFQAEQNDWHALVKAIRRILKGERNLSAFPDLDEEDRIIIEAILLGIQNPDTLPSLDANYDPNLAAPGIASMVHTVRRGNVDALQLVSNMAVQMNQAGGDMARLAAIMRPLIEGERDPDKLCEGFSEAGQKLVLNILAELARLEAH